MNKKLAVLVIIAGVALIIGMVIYGLSSDVKGPSSSQRVSDFQSCKEAGGQIVESYPEQCMLDGLSFVNDAQAPVTDTEIYVGLTEQEAADRATLENKAHRVVERDGEPQPVTMDFQPGRLNFHINDGQVSRVVVESEE